MGASILSARHFQDEEAAYAFVESKLWPSGPVCVHCGGTERVSKMQGKSTRLGVYKCYDCRKQFRVTVGTIFEKSHIALHLWLQAVYLIASSKKGISSNQLHRTLGITLKSAWFMSHRIREAMKEGDLERFGGMGGAVEVDETFIGRDFDKKPLGEKRGRGYGHKYKIVSLIDRQKGLSRSIVVDDLKVQTLYSLLSKNISGVAHLMTDEAGQYRILGKLFAGHSFTNHGSGEYVKRDNPYIHTNTVEGFFSIFKRGMKGVYQHCGHNHLQRYVTEFDFRYNYRKANGWTDEDRAEQLLRGVVGKRLTYETTSSGMRVA
jgi:transposase-like protein